MAEEQDVDEGHLEPAPVTPPAPMPPQAGQPPPHGGRHVADAVVLLAALAFALVVVKIGVVRHLLLEPQAQDLGVLSHFLAHPVSAGLLPGSTFGTPFVHTHVHVTALLLYPFTWFADAALVLLVAQALAIAAAAWILYREASARTGDPATAALLGVGFLADPTNHLATLFDVQPEAFAPLFLALAWRAYRLERLGAWALALAAAALTKENLTLVALAAVAFPLLDRRDRRWVATTLAVGVGTFALLALRSRLAPFDGTYNPVLVFYGHLGASLPEVAGRLLAHPLEALALVAERPHPWVLLVPVLGAPLLRPRWLLLAAPVVLVRALMAPWQLPNWWEFHGAAALAFLGHAALVEVVAGFARGAPDALLVRRRAFAAAATVTALALWGLQVAPRELRAFARERPTSTAARYRELCDRAPRDGTVLASNRCVAPMTDVVALRWTEEWITGRFVQTGPFTLASPPVHDARALVLAAAEDGPLLRQEPAGRARALALAAPMTVLDQVDDLVLLVRGGDGPPLVTRVPRPRDAVTDGLSLEAALARDVVARGEQLELEVVWRRGRAAPPELDLELLLLDARGAVARRVLRPLAWGLLAPADAPSRDGDEALRERATLFVPTELEPGAYTLRLRLLVAPGGAPVAGAGPWPVTVR